MNGLGNKFNYVHIADSVIVDMQDYGAITVFVYESNAEAVISVTRLKDGSGSAVIPDTITEYWTSDGAGGAWTRRTQTAADEVTKPTGAGNSCAAIELDWAKHINPDGGDYNQVNVEVDGSAVVSYILHDLKVQRAPQNLPAVIHS
jgi:hypothetical protein